MKRACSEGCVRSTYAVSLVGVGCGIQVPEVLKPKFETFTLRPVPSAFYAVGLGHLGITLIFASLHYHSYANATGAQEFS